MNFAAIEEKLAQLPLFSYHFFSPKELEFTQRIRWICRNECPMYGKSWACPPGVGTVEECKARCHSYQTCLVIGTAIECADLSNMEATLATRPGHEAVTDQVAQLMRQQVVEPFILSTESCTVCQNCTVTEGKPCRHPEKGFVCKICGYEYEGDTLPADFVCPICKHGADDFEPIE